MINKVRDNVTLTFFYISRNFNAKTEKEDETLSKLLRVTP